MFGKAKADGMNAIAITDHGNMFGVFQFVAEAAQFGLKPIVGCEFYLSENRHVKEFTHDKKDKRYHQLMLAKNATGYKNLMKLCSLGYMEGMYSKWPRIDKELVEKYHEGIIATTCCLGAEVPQTILHKSEEEAEKIFQWWLNIFGEDYYVELQRHNLPEQDKVNEVLLKFAKKYNVKIIATNDSHYVDREDSEAQDILLCINTGDKKSVAIGEGKGYRFGFPNNEFYFKSTDEMTKLFDDLPEAIDNTNEITDKIETLSLKRDILLPNFPIPPEFKNANEYLTHLTWEGAKKRYKIITEEIESRLNFELDIINKMGFAGYFLIVADFIAEGRKMDVMVGPGRGSAAGSAVAYVVGITNIDPIAYKLLFERFLNPERISMPDIDTDFDDLGRQKVIDYVVKKYGRNQVAQIVTYGTMAMKSSIKDVARALDLPLDQANALTKLVPMKLGDKTNFTLKEVFQEVKELKTFYEREDLAGQTLRMAEKLEGSVRNTGVHASAVIIAPDDITNYIPVSTSKESDLLVTQFEGTVIESAGMLKMDFLGLKTLTIIKGAIANVKKNHGIEIDIDNIPLDDKKTLELFQRGDTTAVFQFEAAHVPPILRDLKPANLEELIILNAMNRPGPSKFIPNYINRKFGKEKVEYPHPLLEDLLKPTNGILVYQEQIMLCAQIIAGYTLGGADLLRRAMGKKDKEKMAKERVKFVKGAGEKNQVDEKKANEIFDLMERFAEYGFNRSHAAVYSIVAYQTAYLKANYPAEFMASVLSEKLSSLDEITFLIDECKRMKIPVSGPDINESEYNFTPNSAGRIRFGLGAIKGLGEAAVNQILEERNANGKFKSLFELCNRVAARTLSKKSIEALVLAGALDSFEKERAQYFVSAPGETQTIIDKALKRATSSKSANTNNLFGTSISESDDEPKFPYADPWRKVEMLKKEKEITGIYLSGHPLDEFKFDMASFCNCQVSNIETQLNREISIAGIITETIDKPSKKGNLYRRFTIEDYSGSYTGFLFGEQFLKYKHITEVGTTVYLKGKYQRQKYDESKTEFKIYDVKLLSEIREALARKVLLMIGLYDVSDKTIEKIDTLIKKYSGKMPMQIFVRDTLNNYEVSFNSSKLSVNINNEFIAEALTIPGLEIKLN